MGYLLADHVRRKTLLGGNVRLRADSGQLPCFPRPTPDFAYAADSKFRNRRPTIPKTGLPPQSFARPSLLHPVSSDLLFKAGLVQGDPSVSNSPSNRFDVNQAIRRRAEEIYERNGKLPGRDLHNWAQAES